MSDWIAIPPTPASPRVRLFCLPYAGGGTGIFRDWARALPAHVAVCPVKLPGRETRFTEPAFTDTAALIDAMAPAFRDLLDRPYAIFGHSMGAILAFEIARRLAGGTRAPSRVFASGRQAPHIPDPESPCHQFADDAFIEALKERYGSDTPAFQHPELIELMLPTLRADCTVCETYRPLPGDALACGLTAIGGDRDEMVTTDDLDAWAEHTTGPFDRVMLPGDHFFLDRDPAPLLRTIAERLDGIDA